MGYQIFKLFTWVTLFLLHDMLKSHDAELVCKWLCRYVMETRREYGNPYPPSTLRSLLSGVMQSHTANSSLHS